MLKIFILCFYPSIIDEHIFSSFILRRRYFCGWCRYTPTKKTLSTTGTFREWSLFFFGESNRAFLSFAYFWHTKYNGISFNGNHRVWINQFSDIFQTGKSVSARNTSHLVFKHYCWRKKWKNSNDIVFCLAENKRRIWKLDRRGLQHTPKHTYKYWFGTLNSKMCAIHTNWVDSSLTN